MPSHVETLDKGLYTGLPTALMPEGSLARATNARYDVGNPTLKQAEGRSKLGTTAAPSIVQGMANLRWDPGTRESLADESLNQLLYYSSHQWYLKDVYDGPDDPGWTLTRKAILADGSNFKLPPQGYIEATQVNSLYVLTTGPSYVIARNAVVDGVKTGNNYQYARRLGMTEFGTTEDGLKASKYAPIITISSAAGTEHFPIGYIHFWFTWYDSVNDIEGALGTDDALGYVRVATTAQASDVKIYINQDVLDVAPTNADSIRIYRTISKEPERAQSGAGLAPVQIGWPIGYRIGEVTLASLPGAGDTTKTDKDNESVAVHLALTYGDVNGDDIDEAFVTQGLPDYAGGSYSVGVGAAIPFSLNGPPPLFSTCTVFEECLVTNDLRKRNRIKWSLPNDPDHFATFAFIDFDTDDQDEVIKVSTLGNVLMVYLRNSVWRVEYLPTTGDPLFSRGRVRDLIDQTKGAVANRAVCPLHIAGQGPMHAFVHSTGVYATNGDATVPLTNHVDWTAMVGNPAGLIGKCWLINNAEKQRLELYLYQQSYYLHYDAAHLSQRGGELVCAVTGPMSREGGNIDAISVITPAGLSRTITASETRELFYEGFGLTDAATGESCKMDIETRDLYLTGPLNEFRLNKVLSKALLTGTGAKLTLAGYIGDAWGEEFQFIDNIEQAKSSHAISVEYTKGDYIRLRYYGPDNGASHGIQFVALEFENLGSTETD